jgi:hypothetical protein
MIAEMDQTSLIALPTLLEVHAVTMSGNVQAETNASLSHSSVMVKMIARIIATRWDVDHLRLLSPPLHC